MDKFLDNYAKLAKKRVSRNDPFICTHYDCDSETFVGSIGVRCESEYRDHSRVLITPEIIEELQEEGLTKWDEELHEYPSLRKLKKGVICWRDDGANENDVIDININAKTVEELFDEMNRILERWLKLI